MKLCVLFTVPMAHRMLFLIMAAMLSMNSRDVAQGSKQVVLMYLTEMSLSTGNYKMKRMHEKKLLTFKRLHLMKYPTFVPEFIIVSKRYTNNFWSAKEWVPVNISPKSYRSFFTSRN